MAISPEKSRNRSLSNIITFAFLLIWDNLLRYFFIFPRVELTMDNGNFPNKSIIKKHPLIKWLSLRKIPAREVWQDSFQMMLFSLYLRNLFWRSPVESLVHISHLVTTLFPYESLLKKKLDPFSNIGSWLSFNYQNLRSRHSVEC